MEHLSMPLVGRVQWSSPQDRRIFRRIAGLCAAALILLAAGEAKAQSCLPLDDHSAFVIADLKLLVSSTEDREGFQRRDLKIPVVDSASISLVTNTRVCDKVVATFRTSVAANWPPPIPTALYVVKAGPVHIGAHVVPSPRAVPGIVRTGPSYVVMVVDSKYRFLSSYSF